MRHCIGATLLVALFVVSISASAGLAQERKPRTPRERGRAKPRDAAAELAAIRAGSQSFVDTFNAGDAQEIAALWTEEGEFVDATGRTFAGRAAIAREYAQFFAAHPGQKLRLKVDSIKLLSDSAAIEDGRVILDPAPPGPPAVSKYTVVHVKVDGKWLMSTVRDTRTETASTYHNVADLEWLIGTWTAEEHGAKTESVCRWIANKSFVERTYTITHADGTTATGVQVIGFNPQAGHVQSWNFSSDGGHAIGVWTPREQGWSAEIRGTMGDGVATTAVNLLTRLDDNAYAWQSVQRTAGGAALPDTDEVVLKRSSSGR